MKTTVRNWKLKKKRNWKTLSRLPKMSLALNIGSSEKNSKFSTTTLFEMKYLIRELSFPIFVGLSSQFLCWVPKDWRSPDCSGSFLFNQRSSRWQQPCSGVVSNLLYGANHVKTASSALFPGGVSIKGLDNEGKEIELMGVAEKFQRTVQCFVGTLQTNQTFNWQVFTETSK